jgi:hypothetical protein
MSTLPWLLASVLTAAPAPAPPAVVVELFTSEGCSSCPSADALAMKLDDEKAPVFALEFHVDYWNRLGWADPYSDPAFTARQSRYVRALGLSAEYTPQAVVQGQLDRLGSREPGLREAIAAAQAQPPRAAVALARSGATLTVEASAAEGAPPSDVVLVWVERGLVSQVTRGENAGRRLAHAAVVRTLQVLGAATSARQTFAVPVSRGLQAVAFVQARDTLQILGAAGER